jgi:hypothetical protein
MKLNLAIDAAKRAAAKEIIPLYHISHMLVKIKTSLDGPIQLLKLLK